MMEKFGIILVLFVTSYQTIAQNLVPNGSFEQYDTCPYYTGAHIYYAQPWFQPNVSKGDVYNSNNSDYFNSCSTANNVDVPINGAGFQYARTGNAYGGMFVYSDGCSDDSCSVREYIEVGLSSPLISNQKYCVELFCSLADCTVYAIKNLGMYFSEDSLLDSSLYINLPYIPQIEHSSSFLHDTGSWIRVSGIYLAQGNERFVTIGNFRSNSNTDTVRVKAYPDWLKSSYYYIDDVSVTPCLDTCQPPVSKFNYNVNELTVNFNSLTDSATNWFWYFGDSPTADTSQNPVHSYNNSGTYTVTLIACNLTGCCNEICCDTMSVELSVSVGVNELQFSNNKLQVYPNPANSSVTVTARDGDEIRIFDIAGRKIKTIQNFQNTLKFSTYELEQGVYFFSLYNKNQLVSTEKLVLLK